MRVPRITMRRWMVAVAVVGLLMGGIVAIRLKRRRSDFLARATAHAQSVVAIREAKVDLDHTLEIQASLIDGSAKRVTQVSVVGLPSTGRPGESPLEMLRAAIVQQRGESERMGRTIQYHVALARKYEHAALNPWLPVEPDPPEPQ